MATGTGKNAEAVYNRIKKVLMEDSELRTYGMKIFDGLRENVLDTELPCLLLNIKEVDESEIVSDAPFVVEVVMRLEILGFLQVFDTNRQQWIGERKGKGLFRMVSDVKKAFETDLFLNTTAEFFKFGKASVVDGYPTKGFSLDMEIHWMESQQLRLR